MRRLRFDRIRAYDVQSFVLLSSTDIFYENRAFLDCNFITRELQDQLRRWIRFHDFDIISYWPDRMQERFDAFLASTTLPEAVLEPFLDWIEQAASPLGERQSLVNGWMSVLFILEGRADIVPEADERNLYSKWMDRYRIDVAERRQQLVELNEQLSREWDSNPDEKQMKYNVAIKTDWDADVYFNCVVQDNVDIGNVFVILPVRRIFYIFTKFYDRSLCADDKNAMHNLILRLSEIFDLVPRREISSPLEDILREEIRRS